MRHTSPPVTCRRGRIFIRLTGKNAVGRKIVGKKLKFCGQVWYNRGMITFKDIRDNRDIQIYIRHADESMRALGYTEHGFAHVTSVAETAAYVLQTMGYPGREVELVRIAGYMHDIGNLVNRVGHSQSGATMTMRILDKLGMPADEIASVVTAIGNHDEGTGEPVSELAAALILADKSDVRRSRVRASLRAENYDIHDRVNYSVTKAELKINADRTAVRLSLTVDTHYSSIMDYFQIFMERMTLCRQAAKQLSLRFELFINGQQLV